MNVVQRRSAVAILSFAQLVSPPVHECPGAIIVMVMDQSSKRNYYDVNGHPTSISWHNIIGFIAVVYGKLTLQRRMWPLYLLK